MVEIFKTNVNDKGRSQLLSALIYSKCTAARVNFDLDDCDKVLRVEGPGFHTSDIIELLKINGHYCEILI